MRRAHTRELRSETGSGLFARPVSCVLLAPVLLVLHGLGPVRADDVAVYRPHSLGPSDPLGPSDSVGPVRSVGTDPSGTDLSGTGDRLVTEPVDGDPEASASEAAWRDQGPDPRLAPIHSVEEFLRVLAFEDRIDRSRATEPHSVHPGVDPGVDPGVHPGVDPGIGADAGIGDSLLPPETGPETGDSPFYSAYPNQGEMSLLEAPDDPFYEFDRRSSLPREDLFDPIDLRINFDEPPNYVATRDKQPLLDRDQPESRARHEILKGLIKRQFFRHTRRLLKKYWRRQFKDSSMRYEFYTERLTQINHVGRDPEEFDDFNADYYLNRVRDDVFSTNQEGEREMALVEFGPLRINDEGSVDFDLPGLLGMGSRQPLQLSFDPEAQERKKLAARALYSGDHIKFKPEVRLRVDPFRAVNGTYEDILRSYGAGISVEFYSDILRKKLFETELEGKFSREGDFALFFNFVIRERN